MTNYDSAYVIQNHATHSSSRHTQIVFGVLREVRPSNVSRNVKRFRGLRVVELADDAAFRLKIIESLINESSISWAESIMTTWLFAAEGKANSKYQLHIHLASNHASNAMQSRDSPLFLIF